MRAETLLLSIQTVLLLLILLALVLPLNLPPFVENHAWLEVKYIIFDPQDNTRFIECVGMVWINGAPDYNNRPFKFRRGETVQITCPEQLYEATFRFWQREEPEPTYQGLIVTNRTLTIVLTEPKTIWWGNYVGDVP